MRPKPLLLGILLLLSALDVGLYGFAYDLPLKTAIFGPEGQEVPGTIVEMREEKSPSGRNITYIADVAFEDAQGEQYLLRSTYHFVQWYALKEERNARVRYLKSDLHTAVEIHSIQAEKPGILWYLFLCAVFALPGLLLTIVGFSRPEAEEEAASSVYTPRPSTGRKPPRGPLA
jgi:hypothetical protein